MFAYADETGTLHARLYASGPALDLPLEEGIGPIYSPNGSDATGALN
jgi:hypothetical protein